MNRDPRAVSGGAAAGRAEVHSVRVERPAPMMAAGDDLVRAFESIGSGDLAQVGGKGANLGELVRAGLPVPSGFCVTAGAYRQFLQLTGVGDKIDQLLESATPDAADYDGLSKRIQQTIHSAPIPAAIAESVAAAYRDLVKAAGTPQVAVRSSATAEDLPGFSFAGQQDTYLGISGEAASVDAVRRCWASLWTSRAISYRQTHGFRHRDVYIAVVVQEMFASEVSGVMFTANPLTGDRRYVVINASWGLGEAIVSGLVSPDYWTLDKATGRMLEERLGDKAERIDQEVGSSGVVHSNVGEVERARPCLTADQLTELARIGRLIEEHYGFPQDVEWGYAHGRFAILQAREVTGVEIDFGEELDRWNRTEPDDDEIVWSRAWADAFQTSPTTPLMYSIQQSFIARSYDDMYKLYGLKSFLRSRMYRWHRTRPYYSSKYEAARLTLMPRIARTDDALAFIAPEDRERVRALPFKWWVVAYAQIHALFTEPRYSFWQCADTFYKEFPGQVSRYKAAMSIDFGTASYEQLMECFRTSEQCFLEHARSTTPGIMDYCYFLILALGEMLRHWAGDRDQSKFGSLLSGLSTRTVQENIEIWHIARRITQSPHLRALFREEDPVRILAELPKSPEGAAYLTEVRAFIAENGHRGGSERDLAFPRWRHRPELLLSALRTLSSGDASSDPELTETRMRERRERITHEVTDELRCKPGGRFKAALFQLVLRWTLKYVRMRDDQRYYADYYMGARHDIFLALGARLVDSKLIPSPDQIFFLGLQEVDDLWNRRLSAAAAARRIQARQTQHQKYTRQAPPFYVRGGLPLVSEEELKDSSALSGIPASSGRVHARARVCRTLEDARRLQKGDILVATATDPGWTAVFSIIAGVVVETGGPLAHATLVSREYGIPCVTNVNRATERIADGAMITVDGNAGRILLHQAATADA